MEQYNQQKLNTELESFQNIWSGGYLTGYSEKRNQKGLERYLSENLSGKTFLEIGCGGGQWSKFIHDQGVFDVMYCIDALSEDHNNFWDNLGEQAKDTIDYKKVDNFSLDFIEDNSLDFVFSNPPYIRIGDESVDELVRGNEPDTSLFSQQNGFYDINKIINYSRKCLSKNGVLFLENGTGQTNNISAYLELNDFTDIRVHIDYNGHDRFTSSRINNG